MKISVIIPTLNEELVLPGAIERLRSTSDRGATEIVVVDAQSEDRTAEISRAAADRTLETPRRGRAFQMHQGALAASGELLLFLHADTRLPGDWQAVLRRAWSSKNRPIAAAFTLKFEIDEPFYRFLAAAAKLRTSLTGVPQGDQALALEREAYFRVGGFPPVPLMEEYALCAKLAKLGRIAVLPQPAAASVRRYEKNGKFSNALRNAFLVALFYAGVSPRLLARFYR